MGVEPTSPCRCDYTMIHFERTQDYALIRQIITHPRVYAHVSDDYSPKVEDFKPVENDDWWYVLVQDAREILGLWIVTPHTHCCWEIHTCLLPTAWGRRAKEAAQLLGPWLWEHLPECVRIVTEVPEYNRAAFLFALQSGMEKYGVNPKAYLKDGKLQDVILLGVSRPSKTAGASPDFASTATRPVHSADNRRELNPQSPAPEAF